MNGEEKEVVLKAWEVFQGLAEGLGDSCWKIRSVFYTASSALIAYGFVHSEPRLYIVVLFLSLFFFILESGYKQVQNQYIAKSRRIEATLTDILVGEKEPFLPAEGISTTIAKPTLWKCFTLPIRGGFFFWSPYMVICLAAIALWLVRFSAHESTSKVTLVTDSSIEGKEGAPVVRSVASDWQERWAQIAKSIDLLGKEVASLKPEPTIVHDAPTPVPVVPSPNKGGQASGDSAQYNCRCRPGCLDSKRASKGVMPHKR